MSSFYIIDVKKGNLTNPMSEDLDMNSNSISNVSDPSEDKDVANKKYVDSKSGNNISGNLVVDGNLQFKRKGRIENLFEPDFASDAVTKKYTDDNFVNVDGSSQMTGKLHMGNNKISFDSSPVENTDAATKLYVDIGDGGKLSIHGTNSMAAKLNMSNNRIGNVADPGNPEDAANKKYVDQKTGEFLKRDGSNSMTQHLNMNNKRIFNLLDPGQRDHAVTKGHMDDYVQLELQPKRLGVEGSWSSDATSYHQFWIQHPVSKKAGWHVGNQKQAARANDNDLYFTVSYSTGTKKTVAYISDANNLTEMNFTGQHRCVLYKQNEKFKTGLIVSSTGVYRNMLDGSGARQNHVTINDALPIVEISDIQNDRRVFGVLSGVENQRVHSSGSFHTTLEKIPGDDRVFVNSLGEGGIWVCNAGGSLRNEDNLAKSLAHFYFYYHLKKFLNYRDFRSYDLSPLDSKEWNMYHWYNRFVWYHPQIHYTEKSLKRTKDDIIRNIKIIGNKVHYDVRGKRRDFGKDYLMMIKEKSNGLTKVGQLLFQESCQAYVYCVLGSQANTRWKIIGDSANSFQTQKVFQSLVEDTVSQNNTTKLISSMRIAISSTKVRLDYCISPGLELLPSKMIYIKDSPGYNNILIVSTKSQKFGVNNVNGKLKITQKPIEKIPLKSTTALSAPSVKKYEKPSTSKPESTSTIVVEGAVIALAARLAWLFLL